PMAPSSTRMRSRASSRSVRSAGDMRSEEFGTDLASRSGVLPLPIGERGGGRGARGSCLIDGAQKLFQHAINISSYIVVPKSQDEVTHGFQNRGPICITPSLPIMLAAIKFQDQFGLRAEEVRDETVNRDLLLELPTRESAITQTEPQQ